MDLHHPYCHLEQVSLMHTYFHLQNLMNLKKTHQEKNKNQKFLSNFMNLYYILVILLDILPCGDGIIGVPGPGGPLEPGGPY